MTTTSPDLHYERGLALLEMRQFAKATVHFRAAMVIEQQQRVLRPSMRFASYYAVSRALDNKLTHDDLVICEQAAAKDDYDPVLQLNLAKVYLRAHKTVKALSTIRRGLKLDPANEPLRRLLVETDRRAKPVVPLLSRDHPLNRSLGRLRASLGNSHR